MRVPISTPFTIGDVNCYFFGGEELTVVDPGPATDGAYDQLVDALAQHDYHIEDINRVIITHPHMDHFGGTQRIVNQSDAHVLAHENAVEWMANPIDHFRSEQAYFRPFLLSMGVPAETVDTVLELPEAYVMYQDPVTITHGVSDGETIGNAVELECLSTPGHAPGSMCYWFKSENLMFTGDHVLPEITPNPMLTLTPNTSDERTRSLPTYLESLRKLLEFKDMIGYGGHGRPIPVLQDRARQTISHHLDRKERIADYVAANGPTTAYTIMRELFPDLPATEMFSGMSEVVGHLDLLEDDNRVHQRETDSVLRYEQTS